MNWKDVATYVGNAAPLLGSILGGPAGGAVGELVSKALGTEGSPDQVMAQLQGNPDALVKIKELELAHTIELQKIQFGIIQANFADTQGARGAEAVRVQATGKLDVNLYVLAWTVIIAFFITCGMLCFVELKTAQANIVYMLLGTLATGFATVLGYFFGSSKSSSDKTAILAGK
jgi:hypothetical protein